MTRDTTATPNRIALLATGDEITNGDILNTNAQIIAQKLFSNGMHIGQHMTVSDNTSEIEQAITFLLSTHRALIITGGLGPTSDDITRYALGKALNRQLAFDDATWQSICDRFKTLGYQGEPPEGNRQQALFPDGAKIISNPSGTAAGCMIDHQEQLIFMLPGPPFECLPMVDTFVLPKLKQAQFSEILFYDHWLLFGVSESVIAEQLDALAKPYQCTTGYRLAYPYIEFKIYSNHEKDFRAFVALAEKALAPHLISDGKQTASSMLKKKIETLDFVLSIHDNATGGVFESLIKTPKNSANLDFFAEKPAVKILGLSEYWEEEDASDTSIEIQFSNGSTVKRNIPLRGRESRVKLFAVEYICEQIYLFLENKK